MIRNSLIGWNRKKLRLWLMIFFMALAIPTMVLIYQAWSQLKWEAFHRHSLMAEELANRIDRNFFELINSEEARSFTDYAFLNVVGDPEVNFLQRSPLSAYPVNSALPGLIGYFQVDTQGRFSSPLLPRIPEQSLAYGITEPELVERRALQKTIQQILSQNRLVQKQESKDIVEGLGAQENKGDYASAADLDVIYADDAGLISAVESVSESSLEEVAVSAQSAFDELEKDERQTIALRTIGRGRVDDLKLSLAYEEIAGTTPPAVAFSRKIAEPKTRSKRKEQSVLPEQIEVSYQSPAKAGSNTNELRISIFESEIDAFEVSMLDSGHFVFFRKVWRDGQRYIQGALIDPEQILTSVIETAFRNTALSLMSDLTVAYQGNVFSVFSGQSRQQYTPRAEDLSGTLLYQTSLSTPLNNVELIFSVNNLPTGAGGVVVTWVAAILLLIMSGGFYLMYRLGLAQINLTQQQQDFVSAVSHELKTPLTSIRMYGEMLREGWAEEEKKKTYYDYIYYESERLSRLINNVLQLARMTRNDLKVELKQISISELMDGIKSKVASQVERAGFKLNLDCDHETRDVFINVDADCFSQIIINLVDNAIKFSRKSETRDIDIKCQARRNGSVVLSVRDYGPGVSKGHMKKIFRLFYRPENELTRETVGTGIGLALVNQLAQAMKANVDVVNCEPGAEFRVSFPLVKS